MSEDPLTVAIATVVIIGFIADHLGLQTTYIISSLLGLLAIPAILKIPKKNDDKEAVAGLTSS